MSLYAQAAEQAYRSLLELESHALNDADRRFYASYLLGHLSLIRSDSKNDDQALAPRLNAALDEAFGVDRLSDRDKKGIRSLWREISAGIGLAH